MIINSITVLYLFAIIHQSPFALHVCWFGFRLNCNICTAYARKTCKYSSHFDSCDDITCFLCNVICIKDCMYFLFFKHKGVRSRKWCPSVVSVSITLFDWLVHQPDQSTKQESPTPYSTYPFSILSSYIYSLIHHFKYICVKWNGNLALIKWEVFVGEFFGFARCHLKLAFLKFPREVQHIHCVMVYLKKLSVYSTAQELISQRLPSDVHEALES